LGQLPELYCPAAGWRLEGRRPMATCDRHGRSSRSRGEFPYDSTVKLAAAARRLCTRRFRISWPAKQHRLALAQPQVQTYCAKNEGQDDGSRRRCGRKWGLRCCVSAAPLSQRQVRRKMSFPDAKVLGEQQGLCLFATAQKADDSAAEVAGAAYKDRQGQAGNGVGSEGGDQETT